MNPGDRVRVVHVKSGWAYAATVMPPLPRDADLHVRLEDTPPTSLFFRPGESLTREEVYRLEPASDQVEITRPAPAESEAPGRRRRFRFPRGDS